MWAEPVAANVCRRTVNTGHYCATLVDRSFMPSRPFEASGRFNSPFSRVQEKEAER